MCKSGFFSLFSKKLLCINLDVVGTVTGVDGCVMLEYLFHWSFLESASFPGTGSAPMCLENSDAGKHIYLQEPFGFG